MTEDFYWLSAKRAMTKNTDNIMYSIILERGILRIKV
jgi:hypothetical protein